MTSPPDLGSQSDIIPQPLTNRHFNDPAGPLGLFERGIPVGHQGRQRLSALEVMEQDSGSQDIGE